MINQQSNMTSSHENLEIIPSSMIESSSIENVQIVLLNKNEKNSDSPNKHCASMHLKQKTTFNKTIRFALYFTMILLGFGIAIIQIIRIFDKKIK